MNRKTKLITIVCSMLILLATTAPSHAATPADLCSILTPAQLQNIFGQSFGNAEKSTALPAYRGQDPGAHCTYANQNARNMSVTFIAYLDKSDEEAKQTFEKLSMWYQAKSKPSGIGDAAYIDSKNAIHVLKGKVRYFISIDAPGQFTPDREKQLKDVAMAVAAGI